MYATGLRVSELLNLRVRDLNIREGYGWVRSGKGNKGRQFIIADSLRHVIKSFIKDKDGFIFTNSKNQPLTSSTVRKILKTAAKKTKLNHIYHHLLRHSFGTRVINNGYPATELQPLIGHNSL